MLFLPAQENGTASKRATRQTKADNRHRERCALDASGDATAPPSPRELPSSHFVTSWTVGSLSRSGLHVWLWSWFAAPRVMPGIGQGEAAVGHDVYHRPLQVGGVVPRQKGGK
jgi:hypothetical protein